MAILGQTSAVILVLRSVARFPFVFAVFGQSPFIVPSVRNLMGFVNGSRMPIVVGVVRGCSTPLVVDDLAEWGDFRPSAAICVVKSPGDLRKVL